MLWTYKSEEGEQRLEWFSNDWTNNFVFVKIIFETLAL